MGKGLVVTPTKEKTPQYLIGRCPRKEEGGSIFIVALTLR